ncbi:hypothetical protein [[Mycobacterium] wendilense]|uniref:Mammalian cell entry protein n=1 Tax=[Mycobacterium] wendilense TaxID=3064284 RepID=A0ABN9NWL8_9MYCO|nr:hypothetical protein [Mycolicibacterium sp. MU0050]CAJ1581355.1 hypothetical protein MU0050_001521 [Mycolicibacterium sp. MU0050]
MASSSTNDDREAVLSLAEQAEAEAEAAEAEAAAARARAAKLRAEQAAQAEAEPDVPAEPETAAEPEAAIVEAETDEPEAAEPVEYPADAAPTASRRRWIPPWPVLAVAAAVVAICGLLAASGFMLWTSRQETARQATDAEYAAAARQGVINLMSLDFNQGEADLQRLIDSTTGDFRADFEASKDDFLTVMNESKVVTEADVRATAVEKTGEDTATVLVAASSKVTNTAGAEQNPRAWRLSIDVARDNGQVKMSKVEFVP